MATYSFYMHVIRLTPVSWRDRISPTARRRRREEEGKLNERFLKTLVRLADQLELYDKVAEKIKKADDTVEEVTGRPN